MYKLLATDLDGTLLDDSGGIPEANTEYIQKIIDYGVPVALCSGRSYIPLGEFERRLGLNKRGGYGICFNGGIVYDAHTREIISDIRMPRAVAHELAAEIKRILNDPAVGVLMYAGADLYTERANENSQHYAARSILKLQTVNAFEEIPGNPSKILLKGANASLRHIYESLSGFIGGRCKMFFSGSELLECVPIDSGKARGLQILAERMGISLAETIAVGDHVNDIEMLEAAGLGIAVANAVPEVKAAAGYVLSTDNNAGVFKEIFETFIYK